MKQIKIDYMAFALLLLPVSLLLVCGLTWCVGLTINAFTFPMGLVLAFGAANYFTNCKVVQLKSMAFLVLGMLWLGIICYLIHDPAYDGNWYHQPGIYFLSHGWNPIYQHHSTKIFDDSANMWIDHYAKGQETICATIVAFAGNMEIGKLGNFFLPLSSFLFSVMALMKMFADWSRKKIWLIAFIVAFPPIIWNQVLSFYIDFNLYSIVLIALCSMVLYREDKSKFILVFVALLTMAISVKYNMLMWLGLLYLGLMVYFWRMGNRKMAGCILGYGIAGALIAILTFSFNPYISNMMDHESPFYPIAGGANNVDIMTHTEPKFFQGYNRMEKILVADFSRPTTQSQSLYYQFPYGGYPLKNLTACGSVDVKLGGAGLLWIDVLILSLILFLLTRSYRSKGGKSVMALSAIFIATQFLVPGGWFYRYVCYIYLIPILLLFSTEKEMIGKKLGLLRKITYSLLFVNSLVAFGATLSTTIVANQIEDYYVKCINNSNKTCFSSNLFGFVRKIEPHKRNLVSKEPSKKMEQIPLLPTRVRIYIDYEAINRDVPTTFVQEILLKKGVLK